MAQHRAGFVAASGRAARLGANAALRAMILADAAEARGGHPSRIARAVDAILSR